MCCAHSFTAHNYIQHNVRRENLDLAIIDLVDCMGPRRFRVQGVRSDRSILVGKLHSAPNVVIGEARLGDGVHDVTKL